MTEHRDPRVILAEMDRYRATADPYLAPVRQSSQYLSPRSLDGMARARRETARLDAANERYNTHLRELSAEFEAACWAWDIDPDFYDEADFD